MLPYKEKRNKGREREKKKKIYFCCFSQMRMRGSSQAWTEWRLPSPSLTQMEMGILTGKSLKR